MLITATLNYDPLRIGSQVPLFPLVGHGSSSAWAIISLAILSVVCYGLFIMLVVRAGPVFASQTAYIVTLSGVFWGILIFGEERTHFGSGRLWLSMLIALALVTPRKGVRT